MNKNYSGGGRSKQIVALNQEGAFSVTLTLAPFLFPATVLPLNPPAVRLARGGGKEKKIRPATKARHKAHTSGHMLQHSSGHVTILLGDQESRA
ncbi:hypothetical protein BJY01DRAFT_217268 [Aspergillus pseudoustus]|uniref:Uncharacterized protein n=1 Tax=Aspergillus pseudoustus TaxID=1810923 RepID=A0ABR4JRF8_9EURO